MTATLEKLRPNILRSLSAVSLHKAVQVAGLVATVALVPRLFGAEDYGRFAFVLSLSYLVQMLGDFGTLDVMGRFVPGMSPVESARLYMRHLAFKLAAGALCGLLAAGAALALGQWMRPDWAVLTGLGVALHVVAWVPFQFALGLNRVSAWMSEQAWRQWVLLGLLLALLPPLGLTGALVALLLMELIFCLMGLWVVRDYWRLPELRFDWPYLRPFARFGFGFFLANLAAVALYRSGPLLVEALTRESAQTGYFNLALGLFLLAYVTTGQFAQSLIPGLSDFYNRDQIGQMQAWLANFMRYGWLVGWLGALAVWATAGWAAPLVFGADFAPAATALKWISLGMPLSALLWAANVTATVTGRGRLKFAASLAALAIFGAAGVWLIPLLDAAGASLALALAVTVNAAILSLSLHPDFKLDGWWLGGTAIAGSVSLLALNWIT